MVFELTTLMVIGTDYTGRCKSNYHTITMNPYTVEDITILVRTIVHIDILGDKRCTGRLECNNISVISVFIVPQDNFSGDRH